MKTFDVKIHSSKIRTTISFIGLLAALTFLIFTAILKIQSLVIIIIFFAIGGGGMFLSKKLCKARAAFSITKNGFTIKWVENFKLFRRRNYNYELTDLEEYVIEYIAGYYILKLKDKAGQKVKFEFNSQDQEYETTMSLLLELQQTFSKFNKKSQNNHIIKIGKNMWQTLTTKLAGIILIVVVLLFLYNFEYDKDNYSKLIGMSGLIVVTIITIRRIVLENIKRRENPET